MRKQRQAGKIIAIVIPKPTQSKFQSAIISSVFLPGMGVLTSASPAARQLPTSSHSAESQSQAAL